eukprot:338937-Pelagomonas_calceolata.AAC.2
MPTAQWAALVWRPSVFILLLAMRASVSSQLTQDTCASHIVWHARTEDTQATCVCSSPVAFNRDMHVHIARWPPTCTYAGLFGDKNGLNNALKKQPA